MPLTNHNSSDVGEVTIINPESMSYVCHVTWLALAGWSANLANWLHGVIVVPGVFPVWRNIPISIECLIDQCAGCMDFNGMTLCSMQYPLSLQPVLEPFKTLAPNVRQEVMIKITTNDMHACIYICTVILPSDSSIVCHLKATMCKVRSIYKYPMFHSYVQWHQYKDANGCVWK